MPELLKSLLTGHTRVPRGVARGTLGVLYEYSRALSVKFSR
jgi:hypothetical protein